MDKFWRLRANNFKALFRVLFHHDKRLLLTFFSKRKKTILHSRLVISRWHSHGRLGTSCVRIISKHYFESCFTMTVLWSWPAFFMLAAALSIWFNESKCQLALFIKARMLYGSQTACVHQCSVLHAGSKCLFHLRACSTFFKSFIINCYNSCLSDDSTLRAIVLSLAHTSIGKNITDWK